jgi:hypothetical protein
MLVVAACGRLGFDARSDATQDGFPSGPFGAPKLIAELSSPGNDDDPTLTEDLLEIYFASTRISNTAGVADVFRTVRASATDAWGIPAPVTELNTNNNDENPGIAPDGLTMWLSSDRDGDLDIYVTTRASRGEPWSTPVRVPELSAPGDDLGSEPARSLVRMTLYRDGPRNLYEARRPSPSSAWSAPQQIAELNTANDDLSGFFVDDLEIWFTSNRPGGPGEHDLRRAIRSSLDEPFGAPVLIEGVNSPARDDDPWLSPDGRTLVFVSTRSGDEEIYVAERVE